MSDISKLPKWAQDHINTLQRQRDEAVNSLETWSDNQTPQPIRVDELTCVAQPPSYITRYVEGHSVKIVWLGVCVDIILREREIDIKYYDENRESKPVLMMPTSYQSISLRLP